VGIRSPEGRHDFTNATWIVSTLLLLLACDQNLKSRSAGDIHNLTIWAHINFATLLFDVPVCARKQIDAIRSVPLDTKLSVAWIGLNVLKVTGIHFVIKGRTVLQSLKLRHSRSFSVWNAFSTACHAEYKTEPVSKSPAFSAG
jgi:hypothetical protein